MRNTSSLPVRCLAKHPRRNLPRSKGGKRTEDGFVLAFSRAYTQRVAQESTAGDSSAHGGARELPVTGFGIADFVWICWSAPPGEDGSAVGLRQKAPTSSVLLAFEMKMKNWSRALSQAFRYRYFAHAAYVVLPPEEASKAQKFLALFKQTRVGLWSFDKRTKRIRKFFSPRKAQPLSANAHQKALATLKRYVKVPPAA